jgi:hypothetical protein
MFCSLSMLFVVVFVFAKDKQSAPLQTSNLRFTVVKDDNNKAVRNASVILHLVKQDGQQEKGGFQLKTDNEGITETEGIPYGPIRIQVLAPGMQTFGEDYQIDKPKMDIEIRLKRPGDQLSVYDKPKSKQQAAPATPPAASKPQ